MDGAGIIGKFTTGLVVSLAALILPVLADGPAVVIGSFQEAANARQLQSRLSRQLSRPVRVLPNQTGGSTYYRVVIMDPEARKLVLELRKQGFRDAWYLENAEGKAPSLARKKTGMAVPPAVDPAGSDPHPVPQASQPAVGPAAVPVRSGRIVTGSVDATIDPIAITRFGKADITIDGRLDEVLWSEVPAWDNMSVVNPDLLTKPQYRTLTRMFYTDEGLYVGISAEQPADTLIPRLSSRDGDLNRDGITFYLDTSGEGLYGFFFGVNLGGTLVDGTLLPERQLSRLWDGAWYGEAATTSTGYSTEMFIPWSTMSMPDGSEVRKMGFSVVRKVAFLDEEWEWPALPASKPRFMSGLQPIQLEHVAPRQQLAYYPFSALTLDRMRDEAEVRIGMDVFWRPSTNLQMTATLQPDFGTVESDDVVINLTDFETFFPEKRLFFLEGNETFVTSPRSQVRSSTQRTTGARSTPSTFVLEPTTLVNTRRIGGPAPDPDIPEGVTIPDVELGKPTALLGAAKVTGQKGAVRYGALFASEEDTNFFGKTRDGRPAVVKQVGRDFGVLRFLYENTNRGRKSIGWISTLVAHPTRDAVTHGIDGHYLSSDGRFFWDAQILASDIEGERGYGGFVDVSFIPKQGDFHRFTFDRFDDKLNVDDFGFIRRNDVTTLRYTFSRTTSRLRHFRNFSNSLSFSHEYNGKGQMVRSSIFNRNILTFNDLSQLTTVTMWRPGQWDDRNSGGNGAYRTRPGGVIDVSYGTATSKILSASIGATAITEPLGNVSWIGKAGVTFKPNDRFSLDFDYSYRRTDRWMVHLAGRTMGAYDAFHIEPRVGIDLFLTARQQIRFSLQWVGIKARAQDLYEIPIGDGSLVPLTKGIVGSDFDFTISRLTAQLRYRWEIAPLSDLFVVYTRGSNLPNRQVDGFESLFRDAVTDPVIDQLVVKLRYRFGS